jgi:hypothetical protein
MIGYVYYQIATQTMLHSNGLQKTEDTTTYTTIAMRAPTDVVREIFVQYADLIRPCFEPNDPSACREASAKLYNGPWILGRICSTWRSIALDYPQLWSRLYIWRGHHANMHPSTRAAVAESLRRSRTAGLDIKICPLLVGRAEDDSDFFGDDWIGRLFEQLLPHWSRCVSLRFVHCVTIRDAFNQVFTKGGFNSIEDLEIEAWSYKVVDSQPGNMYPCFNELSGLRRLSLTEIPLSTVTVPCRNLRSFRVSYTSTPHLKAYRVLQGAPNLRELSITMTVGRPEKLSGELPLLVHRNLKILDIDRSQRALHLAQSLALPNLQVLRISDPAEPTNGSPTICPFFTSLACHSLHTLRLDSTDIGVDTVNILRLPYTKSLRVLVIDVRDWYGEEFDGGCLSTFFHAFASSDHGDENFLPNLTHLEVTVWSHFSPFSSKHHQETVSSLDLPFFLKLDTWRQDKLPQASRRGHQTTALQVQLKFRFRAVFPNIQLREWNLLSRWARERFHIHIYTCDYADGSLRIISPADCWMHPGLPFGNRRVDYYRHLVEYWISSNK